eukprot:133182_1
MYTKPNNESSDVLPFRNPYRTNQRIQIREINLPIWLNGIILETGFDWIQVTYDDFSKKYDNKIYIDPTHIHFNKHETRLPSFNPIIKNEYKINDNLQSDYKTDIVLNDELLLKHLQQLVIHKRKKK